MTLITARRTAPLPSTAGLDPKRVKLLQRAGSALAKKSAGRINKVLKRGLEAGNWSGAICLAELGAIHVFGATVGLPLSRVLKDLAPEPSAELDLLTAELGRQLTDAGYQYRFEVMETFFDEYSIFVYVCP